MLLPFGLLFFFLLMLLPLDHVMPASDEQRYSTCSNVKRCGGFNITYPFWEFGGEAEDFCGHPGYGVKCREGNLTFSIGDDFYQILDMIMENQSLIIVREDVLHNICPEPRNSFDLDPHYFSLTDHDWDATLLFNCSPPLPPQQLHHQLHCSYSHGDYLLTNLTTRVDDDPMLNSSCQDSLTIPMLQSAAQQLADNRIEAAVALEKGFEVKWTLDGAECLACLNSSGACGYTNSLSQFSCFCIDGPHKGTCSGPLQHPSGTVEPRWQVKIGIAAGAVGGTLFMVTLVASVFITCKRIMFWNSQSKGHQDMENFIRNYGTLVPKRFKHSEVKKMTNSFKEKLGQGGFGAVYKGKLQNGTLIAVKLLHELKGNGEDFINEVASISRTSHVNIVTLLGFCLEGNKRALIYEYMSNQSLDKFICIENPEKHIGWEKLHQIAVGIARGLEYLHRGCNTRILHFDIKPQNILLDDDFHPKISDFGLSQLCLKKESILSTLTTRGTIGYIAPEVFSRNFGGVSHKSDVYSYGMMLIDMVGGRRKPEMGVVQSSETYFPDQVYRLLEQYNNDPAQVIPQEKEICRKMIAVGIWCIQTVPSQRPSMTRVIELLEGSIEALQMPPKPYLFSPPRSLPQESFSSLQSSL